MLSEINAMPSAAQGFLQNSGDYTLPKAVPYIGMGSSYFAPLAFTYMGVDIQPELASEFYNYSSNEKRSGNAVLLSQSGRSTEVLWCSNLFKKYTAICNYPDSPLCKNGAVERVIELLAGDEKYSSSKTYINTLLVLFKGFGIDVSSDVDLMEANIQAYEKKGKAMAEEVFHHLQSGRMNGLYITGSGPNIATAMQAGLIMSESTKLSFQGLPMAQYDHGPKETAKNSVVIQIVAEGKAYDRTKNLSHTITKAGGHVIEIEEPGATENSSVLHNIIPFNYAAYYLSNLLGVREIFAVGAKVTEVQ